MDTVPFLGIWLLSSAWLVMFLWGSFWCLLHASRMSHFFWRCCVHIAYGGQDVCVQVALISFALGKRKKLSTIFENATSIILYSLGKEAGILTGFKTQPRLHSPILLRTAAHFAFFHLFWKLSLAEKNQQIVHEDTISEFSTLTWCNSFFEFPCQSLWSCIVLCFGYVSIVQVSFLYFCSKL